LSRDRRITNRKRNKLTIVAIAGVMTTATAASAAAAAWPSGSSANAAFAKLNAPSAASAAGQASTQQDYLSVQRARAAANHQAVLATLARQAAAKAAAAKKAQAVLAAKQAAARQAAQQAAAKQAAQSSSHSSQQTASATVPAPSGSAQTIAKEMLASFGWPASQFSCLEPLWAHESGWSVTASNPSTGAYGIPQALPGSRMASAGPDWQTNAATQIKWGLGYIKDTYGSPCAAESHEQADGWY
jgi:hypothetical protein